MGMQIKSIAAGIVAVCVIILFLSTYYTVDAYERAVLTRFGSVMSVEGEGLHFKVPFVNSVTFYRTDIQAIAPKKPANTYTIDNQEVDITFNIFYRIAPENVEFIYRNVQDYQQRLEEMVVDRLKSEMGQVNVSHVAEKRGEIRDRVRDVLQHDAKVLGVSVTDFQMPNIDYTKTFREAVEGAAAAKAGVETANQHLEQEKKRADQAREKAAGLADSNLLVARAEATAIQLKGEAEAAAIKAQAEALAQQVNLVELRKAEKWDGKLPATMLSNVVPFMGVDQTGVTAGRK